MWTYLVTWLNHTLWRPLSNRLLLPHTVSKTCRTWPWWDSQIKRGTKSSNLSEYSCCSCSWHTGINFNITLIFGVIWPVCWALCSHSDPLSLYFPFVQSGDGQRRQLWDARHSSNASPCNQAGLPRLPLSAPSRDARLSRSRPHQGPGSGLSPRQPAVPLSVPLSPISPPWQPSQNLRHLPQQRACPARSYQTK